MLAPMPEKCAMLDWGQAHKDGRRRHMNITTSRHSHYDQVQEPLTSGRHSDASRKAAH